MSKSGIHHIIEMSADRRRYTWTPWSLELSWATSMCFNYSQTGGQWRTWLQKENEFSFELLRDCPCTHSLLQPLVWMTELIKPASQFNRPYRGSGLILELWQSNMSNKYWWRDLLSTQIMGVYQQLSVLNWTERGWDDLGCLSNRHSTCWLDQRVQWKDVLPRTHFAFPFLSGFYY